MPTVTVAAESLFEALGERFDKTTFEDLCFEFGIELDDVVEEVPQLPRELQDILAASSGAQQQQQQQQPQLMYKIEVPANRPDLLCLEGLAMNLRTFRSGQAAPKVRTERLKASAIQHMIVEPSVHGIRPYVVCAVLRGITFTPETYKSFLDLQDKLHHNICRRRTLVAIGTHDLDRVQGPFRYKAMPPKDIRFVPLFQDRQFDAEQLLKHYEDNDTKLRAFVPIIRDFPVYPVITDCNDNVLSLPPIINGRLSRLTLDTRNILIECTATDLTKANVVLNTMVTMFAQYCQRPHVVEEVLVQYEQGAQFHLPDLRDRTVDVSVDYVNRAIGIDLTPEEMCRKLANMQLASKYIPSAKVIRSCVPPTRSDVLHACDVMEDVAIAHSFNRIPKKVPTTFSMGRQQYINGLTELMRLELAMAGFTECLTMALLSKRDNFDALRTPDPGNVAVVLSNPKTLEFEICRTTLLPGLLKSLASNRGLAVPIQLFEVSDVVLLDRTTDTGSRNVRHLAALYCNVASGFEVIHGLCERLMLVNRVRNETVDPSTLGANLMHLTDASLSKGSWVMRPSDHPTMFPGRAAEVIVNGQKIGHFGVVHPDVLAAFHITYPCSFLEINLEFLL